MKKNVWSGFKLDKKIIKIGDKAGIRLPKGFAKLGQEVYFIRKGPKRIELVLI